MKLLNFINERKNHIFTDRKDVELWEAFLSAAKFPSPKRGFYFKSENFILQRMKILFFYQKRSRDNKTKINALIISKGIEFLR